MPTQSNVVGTRRAALLVGRELDSVNNTIQRREFRVRVGRPYILSWLPSEHARYLMGIAQLHAMRRDLRVRLAALMADLEEERRVGDDHL